MGPSRPVGSNLEPSFCEVVKLWKLSGYVILTVQPRVLEITSCTSLLSQLGFAAKCN